MQKLIADNRKARQYYELLDFYEAGIVLTGPEVKSLRAGQISFRDSYVDFTNSEAYLVGLHIAPYNFGNMSEQNPDRKRKLLLHMREIIVLNKKVEQKGLSIVPVKVYFKQGKIKLEIALAKGKKFQDRREELKKRAVDRDMEREFVR